MTTANVVLSCKPNGNFFAEKLRIAMNQIQSFEIDVESITRLNEELRIENEQYHQMATDLKDQSQVGSLECLAEKEELSEKNNLLKNDLQECSSKRHCGRKKQHRNQQFTRKY